MPTLEPLETFRLFAQNRLFEGIEPEVLRDMRYGMQLLRFDTDEVVFNEGDEGDSLYLVGSGSVRISKQGRAGSQETLGVIESGNFFGEMALLDGQPRSAMAVATGPTLLAEVDDEVFQNLIDLAPSRLHLNFLRLVSQRLRQVNSHFISELMRTERLSLVGSMANSIIHDLKNPLCIVRCCASLIDRHSDDPKLKELTSMLNNAADGMLSMTQELLDYSKGVVAPAKEKISVAQLLEELNQQSLRLLPGENIQLVKSITYKGELNLDLPRFSRVLCNLIKNAREAMPSGGILTLTIEKVGGEVLMRVCDTGNGIPPEVLSRVFEPFVTHGKSHGTGLGMAIAKSTVEGHGGKISVSSSKGRGTAVEIRLPAV
ncbi:MAG TPA: ATP-binding protein [Chthoniobacterales bacterium]|jgi:signal transduction histidine kinase|nr:ATP-binding protein [Chthoniobacterales bacterium]